MRKNVCFWCIFGRWIQTCFQNFSIAHTFRSRLKGCNLLRQDTNVCFYRGRHEELKDFFSQEDGVVFCNDVCYVMVATNFTQISGACSLIRQKWAWRWLYSTTEIDSPPFLWLMQPTLREFMKAWGYCWERLGMTKLNWSCVVIWRSWHCYWECNWGKLNTTVSCVNGTAGRRRITM